MTLTRAARSLGAVAVVLRLMNTEIMGQYSTSGVALSYICAFFVCLMLFVRINLAKDPAVVLVALSSYLRTRLRNLVKGAPGVTSACRAIQIN